MKTIQEHFREADAEEIINQYSFAHPIVIDPSFDGDATRTVQDLMDSRKANLRGLIERIRNAEPAPDPDGETWIFFVHHIAEDEDGGLTVTYAKKSNILDTNEMLMPYGYELNDIEDTCKSLVADTYLTMRNLDMVLIDYLFESSFFGYEQEGIPEAIARLEKATREIKEHPEIMRPIKELWETIEYEPEVRDDAEHAAWLDMFHATGEYSRIACEVERAKIIELLQ